MAVLNSNSDVSGNGFLVVDTTAVEAGDVSAVNQPLHVAINLFLTSSCQLSETAAADIALSMIIVFCGCLGLEVAGEVELFVVTTSH